MHLFKSFCLASVILLSGCSNECDSNQAMNKMLALGKVQGRLVAKGGDAGMEVAGSFAKDQGIVSELIAQKKYAEACAKADEVAKAHGIDLQAEQKDMITIEQLAKDGGKGSGTCSIADAATKQMEVHGLLQKEVDAGRRSTDVFREFNDDTVGYAEMLSTNPSKACDLMDKLKEKYKLK